MPLEYKCPSPGIDDASVLILNCDEGMVLKYILKFYLKNALKSLTSITDGNLDRIMLRDFLIKINTDLDVITHISAIEIRLFIYSKIKHNLGAIFAKYSEKRQLELLSDKNNDLEKKLTDITNLKKTQKEEQLEKKQTEELEYITKITAIIEAICAKLQLSPGTIKTICITPTQEITPVCDSTATSNFKQYVKTLFKNLNVFLQKNQLILENFKIDEDSIKRTYHDYLNGIKINDDYYIALCLTNSRNERTKLSLPQILFSSHLFFEPTFINFKLMTGGIIIDNFFKGVRLNILKEQLVNLKEQYKSLCYAINTAQSDKFKRSIKVPGDTGYYGGLDYLSREDRYALINTETKERKAQIFAIYMRDIGTPAKEICDNI